MNQVGPDATVADEVASSTLSVDSGGELIWQRLFTGLTLQSGAFYLVLSSDHDQYGWGDTDTRDSPNLLTAPGVVFNGSYVAIFNQQSQYPPSAFSTNTPPLEQGFGTLEFEVTGNPAPVPEPSTFALLGGGLAVLRFRSTRVARMAAERRAR
jgi:hypothetical protein